MEVGSRIKLEMALRSFPTSFLTSNLWPPTSKMVGIPLATEFRRVQNYIKRSTKYLFDYNRRLFKKLQMQGAARLQAEAYSLYVEH